MSNVARIMSYGKLICLLSCMQLERMKNENSLMQDHDFYQKFPTLQREFMQLQKVDKTFFLASYNYYFPSSGLLTFCCFLRSTKNQEACSPCLMNLQGVAMRQKGCLLQKLSLRKLCRERKDQAFIFRGTLSSIAMISLANLNPTGNFLFKDMSCLQYAQVLSCFVIEAGPKRKKTVEFNLAQDLSMIGKISSFFYTDALPSYFFSPLPLAVLSFFFI